MNYDPNLTNSGKMAEQTVELIFQQWEYTAKKTIVVGGNWTGLPVIEAAVENYLEELGYDEGELILTNEAGDTLQVELWENPLAEMLVSARIIAIAPTPKPAAAN